MASLQSISLDDLAKFSPWPARLLGGAHFAAKHRTSDEVLREYDREKWGRVLEGLRTQNEVSADMLHHLQGEDPGQQIAFACGNEFYIGQARQVFKDYEDLIATTIGRFRPRVLAELGSGLGDKLLAMAALFAPQRVWGGEFTLSGVECGGLLAAKRGVEAEFAHFDYTKPETLSGVPTHALVYTSHSIEQIPSLSEAFIDALIIRDPEVVIHFEPCYEGQDQTTLIGLMRRRYLEVNDYNRNLLGLLRSFEQRGRIQVVDFQQDVFGVNPLNPTSIYVWKPV